MKKKKKQTIYNLTPSVRPTVAAGRFDKTIGGGAAVPIDELEPAASEEPEKDNTNGQGTETPAASAADSWTIAGITWEKKKWIIILALLTMNVITLATVAFKKR